MKSTRLALLVVAVITVVGGAIRLAPIAERPLWYDEADTWNATAGMPYLRFVRWTNHFETAPLSFLFTRISMDLAGTHAPWAMRLPAAIFGILCIPAAFLLGRVILGNSLGVLAALLAALSPNAVDQSQQCRMYALFLLLVLVALTWGVALLRRPERGAWHWAGLGLTLGLLLCTLQFSLCIWGAMGLAAGALLAGGWWLGRPEPQPRALISGGLLAALVAVLTAQVGLFMTLQRVFHGGPGDGAHLSLAQIAREIAVAAKDLVVGAGAPGAAMPLALLAWLAGAAGVVLLARRCRTSAVLLAAVVLCNLLMLFPFRRMHHFLAVRYLTPAEIAMWVGLAALPLTLPRRGLRMAALVAVLAYAGVQGWQSVNLQRWWEQPDKYLIAPQIERVRATLAPGEAVAYHPQVLDLLGRYYGLPGEPILHQALYEGVEVRPGATIPPEFDAPATMLIVGMVNWEGRLRRARQTIEALARHYGVTVDEDEVARHLRRDRVVVARFNAEGIELRSVGVGP